MAELVPVPAATLAPAALAPWIARGRLLAARPAVRAALPPAALAAVLAGSVWGWSALTAPAPRDLFPGMGDADKAAVAAALDTGGVHYRVDGASGALRVEADDYHRARMLLAAQGLPKAAPTPDAAAAAIPFGASEAVERERLQAALEADLARTVETVEPVAAARVHLAAEPPSLFVRDRAPPRASVMLTLRPGRTLTDGQVTAIANLVAASVPGLAPEGVSVVDGAGRLLSAPDAQSAAVAGQLATQTRVEERYARAIADVLAPLVGRDGFTAAVHADLDFGATDATRETYPEAARGLASEDQRWTREGGTPPAVGVPGVLSNTPPPGATLAAAGAPGAAPPPPGAAGVTSQDVSRRFQLGREVSVTRGATGGVRRLSLAVAIADTPAHRRTPAELRAIEGLVRGAVGADPARGDLVAVSARPFAIDPVPVVRWWEQPWVWPAARWSGLALALALGWLLVGRRVLRRWEAERAVARTGATTDALGRELAAPAPVTPAMIEGARSYEERAALVRAFVQADRDGAARVLKTMVAGDAPRG